MLRRRSYLVEDRYRDFLRGRGKSEREKFKIVSVSSPREGTFKVEVDGGTSFLNVRVYFNPSSRDEFHIEPTAGWDARKNERPTEREKSAIIKAVKGYMRKNGK